jgi:hypothetical protein
MVVTAVCMFGTVSRVRGVILGFALSVCVATVVLMQSGHWIFSDLSYYGTVVGAALIAVAIGWLVVSARRRGTSP